MSLAQSMRQLCDVRRPTTISGRRNSKEYEWPTGADGLHLEAVRCRLKISQSRVMNDEDRTGQRISFYKIFVPAGTDIKKDDRIENLRERNGEPVGSLFFVEEIMPRRGSAQRHITIKLREVS